MKKDWQVIERASLMKKEAFAGQALAWGANKALSLGMKASKSFANFASNPDRLSSLTKSISSYGNKIKNQIPDFDTKLSTIKTNFNQGVSAFTQGLKNQVKPPSQ